MSIAAYQGVCPTCRYDHSAGTLAPTTRETADHAELTRLAEAAKTVRRDANGRLDGDDAVRMWVAFHDAMSPGVCSALLSEIAALRGEVERVEADRIRTVDDRMTWTRRTLQAERQRDELRKALETIGEMAPSTCETSLAHDMAQFANQALANQGADQ